MSAVPHLPAGMGRPRWLAGRSSAGVAQQMAQPVLALILATLLLLWSSCLVAAQEEESVSVALQAFADESGTSVSLFITSDAEIGAVGFSLVDLQTGDHVEIGQVPTMLAGGSIVFSQGFAVGGAFPLLVFMTIAAVVITGLHLRNCSLKVQGGLASELLLSTQMESQFGKILIVASLTPIPSTNGEPQLLGTAALDQAVLQVCVEDIEVLNLLLDPVDNVVEQECGESSAAREEISCDRAKGLENIFLNAGILRNQVGCVCNRAALPASTIANSSVPAAWLSTSTPSISAA